MHVSDENLRTLRNFLRAEMVRLSLKNKFIEKGFQDQPLELLSVAIHGSFTSVLLRNKDTGSVSIGTAKRHCSCDANDYRRGLTIAVSRAMTAALDGGNMASLQGTSEPTPNLSTSLFDQWQQAW